MNEKAIRQQTLRELLDDMYEIGKDYVMEHEGPESLICDLVVNMFDLDKKERTQPPMDDEKVELEFEKPKKRKKRAKRA